MFITCPTCGITIDQAGISPHRCNRRDMEKRITELEAQVELTTAERDSFIRTTNRLETQLTEVRDDADTRLTLATSIIDDLKAQVEALAMEYVDCHNASAEVSDERIDLSETIEWAQAKAKEVE